MDQYQKIQDWIDSQQKGKSGIYPHKVAQKICVLFSVPIAVAITQVCKHISKTMANENL